MSLKTKKLNQSATKMFISEFEKEESLWNVMSEIYKNRDAKKQVLKDCLNYLQWVVSNWKVFYYLLVSLFASRDSISLIFKGNNSTTVLKLLLPKANLECI